MHPVGKPSYSVGMLSVELLVDMTTAMAETTETIGGLELGELAEPDPMRPSVVVTKAGNRTLWKIAKENGSTLDQIRSANGLEGEPNPDAVLLIPVL